MNVAAAVSWGVWLWAGAMAFWPWDARGLRWTGSPALRYWKAWRARR